eukprot:TRINITY_DN9802_c0_g1_i1.p1 TRINITY_DN9802_c0_g1~~TRINITY_DN9802_c0_g1_i1.p1  ORF type:complete len:146 (+),score=35.32 TRINITY_DN9802_c0_g1_i1:67-504(+)
MSLSESQSQSNEVVNDVPVFDRNKMPEKGILKNGATVPKKGGISFGDDGTPTENTGEHVNVNVNTRRVRKKRPDPSEVSDQEPKKKLQRRATGYTSESAKRERQSIKRLSLPAQSALGKHEDELDTEEVREIKKKKKKDKDCVVM